MYIEDYLPIFMFIALGVLLFTGYPVAFVLGGIGLAFGFIGIAFDVMSSPELFNVTLRIWGGIAESLILVAIPMFIFMGTMLERSGVAADLLHCLQVMLRRVPGGLALSVTLMGTILAASTGIIGASVVMMTLLALPVMMEQRYNKGLATGTIASSGTLGILIPPSIMLVIMADLLGRSVGNLFVAAVFPGFLLSGLYFLYIFIICSLRPSLAPPLGADIGPKSTGAYIVMVARSFIPPVFLIICVLGSILGGVATPTEASAVGAFGATVLAFINPVVVPALSSAPAGQQARPRFGEKFKEFGGTVKDVTERSALTGGMLFGIFIGATCFSFIFKALYGDDLVIDFVESLELHDWGLLILLMALIFMLGFFFDWIEITLIVLPVFAPIINTFDFGVHVPREDTLYWFAILMAVNLQTSFLTPPFGFALFYMKGVAPPSVKIQDIYKGIIPFVMLQLLGLGLVMAFPEIALWLPRQLLD